MCEPCNLRVKLQASNALLLGDFELAFFVVSDGLHPDLLAECGEDAVLCVMNDCGQRVDAFLQRVVVGLSLKT